MTNLDTLKVLCFNVQKKWEISYGVNEIEDLLLQVLNFLKANSENYLEFSNYFVDRLQRKEQFPLEIMIFAMRELQWPEIKQAAISEKEKTDDWRIISAMNDIISVYEEDWEGVDMYEYYMKKKIIK